MLVFRGVRVNYDPSTEVAPPFLAAKRNDSTTLGEFMEFGVIKHADFPGSQASRPSKTKFVYPGIVDP